MIIQNSGLAIDLSEVKAIHTEYLKQGGHLVFEFNNILIPVYKDDTEVTELKSFANDPVKYYIETSDSLRAYFDEWVEIWQNYKN